VLENLCGISAFCDENSEIPHKFVSINVFFKLSNTKLCVMTTQNPCDRFRTHTFLECRLFNEIRFISERARRLFSVNKRQTVV
jgi:hypothetical protein